MQCIIQSPPRFARKGSSLNFQRYAKESLFVVAPRRQNCLIGKKNWKYDIQNAGLEVWLLARNTFALYKDDEK